MTIFVSDSFTGSDGTTLTSHTGETGATWTKHAYANNTAQPTIISNALYPVGDSTNEIYYASGDPANADYTVTFDYTFNGTSGNEIAGCGGRMATGAATGYFFLYLKSSAELRLYKVVSGANSQIGTGVAFTPSSGATYRMTLDMSGTTIAGRIQRLSDSNWLNSSASWQSSQTNVLSQTDSAISGAGKAGFWLDNVSGTSRGSIDAFTAANPASATRVTASGPSPASGQTGIASNNITIAADGAITGTVVVTPSDGGGGGTFTPSTVSISSGTPSATMTYTPGSTGTKTLSFTNNGGLGNPANISYVSGASGGKYTIVDTTDTISGQSIRVLVPNSNAAVPYNAANPTPVVLYCHGNGETYTALVADATKAACVDAMIDAGFILGGSTAHNNNWGNELSVNDYTALEKYIRDNYNVKAVALWGQSAGGLDMLAIVSQSQFPVVGALGTYPVCNLKNLYDGGTYTAGIATAYGITGSGIYTYANQTYGYDPMLKPAAAYGDVPMRFYASPSDTAVPKAYNTDLFAALVANTRSEATVVLCSGNHGDASHFQPSNYVDFFNRCFASSTRTITETLTSDGSTPIANLSGLRWAVFEQSRPGALARAPIAMGTTGQTNSSGVFTISFTSRLAAGDAVWLEITDSDGTTTQSPAAKVFCGPVLLK